MREDGKANGKPIGVLAIHFDWEPQARAIVQGVRVGANDKARVLLVDSNFRVIAASDGQGMLTERVRYRSRAAAAASITTFGRLIAYHATPGYETYRGSAGIGVISFVARVSEATSGAKSRISLRSCGLRHRS